RKRGTSRRNWASSSRKPRASRDDFGLHCSGSNTSARSPSRFAIMNDLSAASSRSLPTIPPLLAFAMRPLPLLPLQLVLAGFLHRIWRRNPTIFDRLGEHSRARFGIKPTDLPFAFVVEAAPPRLSVVRDLAGDLDARISASLANLLALLEG